MKSKLLNATQLGEAMGKGPGYVTAMRAAGYEFEFGNQTTLRHALRWRKKNPAFRSTSYYRAHRRPPADAKGVAGGKSDAPARLNGRYNPSPSAHRRPLPSTLSPLAPALSET